MKASGLIVLASAWLIAGCGGPDNFDQCILENVGNDMNEAAVEAVTRACYNEFPPTEEPQPAEANVPYSAMSQITGRGGGSFGSFSGTLYNGTSYHLSEITIGVTTTSAGNPVTRTYVEDISIAPQTSGSFRFPIVEGDPGTETNWTIDAAKYRE